MPEIFYLVFFAISWIIYLLFPNEKNEKLTPEEAEELYYYIEHFEEIEETYRQFSEMAKSKEKSIKR